MTTNQMLIRATLKNALPAFEASADLSVATAINQAVDKIVAKAPSLPSHLTARPAFAGSLITRPDELSSVAFSLIEKTARDWDMADAISELDSGDKEARAAAALCFAIAESDLAEAH